MTYRLESSYDTVQVFSPTLATEAIYCTIMTAPSGSIVQRTIPKSEFNADQGAGLLESLTAAVEDALAGGLATAAFGTQGVDAAGLIYDAVAFTVTYDPPSPRARPLTTQVEIPMDVLTADTSFGSFLAGGSATERLQAAHDRLATLAGA